MLCLAIFFLALSGLLAVLAFRAGSQFVRVATPLDSERAPGETSPIIEFMMPEEIKTSSSQTVNISLRVNEDERSAGSQSRAEKSSPWVLNGDRIKSATANLVAAGFEISPPPELSKSTEDRDRLDWHWSLAPRQGQEGPQQVHLSVDVEVVPDDGQTYHPDPWSEIREIDVSPGGGSVSALGGVRMILSVVSSLAGLGLSIPFAYTLWKELRQRRVSKKTRRVGRHAG